MKEIDMSGWIVGCVKQIVILSYQLGGENAVTKALGLVVTNSVAVLRGINSQEYIDGFLSSAIKDEENIIHLETEELKPN